jgi:dipeptidase D
MVLDHIEPRSVMGFFEQLCSIPHGSGNTKAISDYCVRFAQERSLECIQDELGNIIIKKPASAGYEAAAPVIIQGHLDMVCEKALDSTINFMTDPLELATDGKYVFARGTTLGGDDGIAVAMALALLDGDGFAHPPLEALFTVDEETGMSGAAGLDAAPLCGRTLLNIDSEVEGVFTVSCAGGVRANCLFPVRRETAELMVAEICVGGLKGGHSGVEIDKGRGNSNILMGRVLSALAEKAEVRMVSLSGGAMDNAIPLETCAVVAMPTADADALVAVIEDMDAAFKKELRATDGGVFVSAHISGVESANAVTAENTLTIIDALTLFPNGIQAMSGDMPGLVQTSLNLGILKLEEDILRACFSLRSSIGSQKEMLKNKLERLIARLGGSVVFSGDYPAWEYRANSPLRDTMVQVYKEQYGQEPEVLAIHAGLECGLLSEKLPGLDCVSFGPNLSDIHTCREKMEIASVQRVWTFLLEVLKRLK